MDGEVSYDVNRVVDGLKFDLSWFGGQCVLLFGRYIVIWWVNFISIFSIYYIIIYNRKEYVELGI